MKKVNNNGPRIDSATDSQDDSDVDHCRNPDAGNSKLPSGNTVYFQNIKIKGYDTTDAMPKQLKFTWWDVFGITMSICTFIFDVAMDILLAYTHAQNENKLYFNLTLAFIAVPSLAMTGFSLRWYLDDADSKRMPPVSPSRWVVRVIFLLLQLGPVLRYVDSLLYGLQSNKHKEDKQKQVSFYKQMIYEDADATLLRLFECFLEAAPQLLLQLYIYAQPHDRPDNSYTVTEIIQLISMFTSLFSMAWALASYQRALRYSLDDKLNMTWCGSIAQILWHFFDLCSRVIALGLFAAVFPLHMAVFCVCHYGIMVTWILIMRTTFCENKCEEFIYNAVLGVVFIFCYFNPKDSPTRRRYAFFYCCIFLENVALMAVWFIYSPSQVSFKYPATVLQLSTFVIGLAIMIVYYMVLHPTKNISIWAYWTKNKNPDFGFQNGDYSAKEITLSVNRTEDM